MNDLLQIPLGLADVRVLETRQARSGEWVITLESTLDHAVCRCCGREIHDAYGYDRPIRLRHLPILDQEVYLELRPRRFRCRYCDDHPTTTQRLDWYEPNRPYTRAFERLVLRELINTTLSDVARKQGLSAEAVQGILEHAVAATVDWTQFTELPTLGIDEIALKKGHRDFVVIVTARAADGRVRALAVLAERTQATVQAFLEAIPVRLQATVRRVCTDLCEAYAGAVRAALPQAQLVADRFHVARLYRDGVDTLRKQELRRLRQALSDAEYAPLKGLLWLLRANRCALDRAQRERLEALFVRSPALRRAYELREYLTHIFDTAPDHAAGLQGLADWRHYVEHEAVPGFERFLGTLAHWHEAIGNYFIARDNSGFVEGLNNRLKVIKRRCYGIFKPEHLFQRLCLDLEGYRLYGRS